MGKYCDVLRSNFKKCKRYCDEKVYCYLHRHCNKYISKLRNKNNEGNNYLIKTA